LPPIVERYSEASVPTEYGPVKVVVYRAPDAPDEHVAIVVGDPASHRGDGASPATEEPPVLVRVHSECWTGEVLRSHKCDCREQLDRALRAMEAAGRGVVVYLRQEGRGIGLGNKIRAYALQEQGVDTVEANRMLGFAEDARTYDLAAAILADLGVRTVALLTNNPKKVAGLAQHGVVVKERVPLSIAPNEHNADYLAVKAKKMGHTL
jgi:GTP cyclohydrolase II/3,4-dihydroxy 2-butanone 4-phosphate synthase/GTP cyclohydrolase II